MLKKYIRETKEEESLGLDLPYRFGKGVEVVIYSICLFRSPKKPKTWNDRHLKISAYSKRIASPIHFQLSFLCYSSYAEKSIMTKS